MIDSTRYPRLSRIEVPADLRRFGEDELPAIAEESVSYTHLTLPTILLV